MIDLNSEDVQSILPYLEEKTYREALERLLNNQAFTSALQGLFPLLPWKNWTLAARQIKNVKEFHAQLVAPIVEGLLKFNASGLTLSGMEALRNQSHSYLLLSNHRDIVCDPALIAYSLYKNGLDSPYICLGDNLLTSPLVVDLVKLNRAITVKRDLSPRELLKWSKILSQVIDHLVSQEKKSVWIAQREGRAKDGKDQTHLGVLKMLGMAKDESFLSVVQNLHILPIAISYEYDPCDALKARELYLTEKDGTYEKSSSEDIESMRIGILGFKGRVHIGFGAELTAEVLASAQSLGKRDQVSWVGQRIDQEIYRSYKNWPSHYIAYDLYHQGSEMDRYYTDPEKQAFIERMHQQLKTLKDRRLAQEQDLKEIEKRLLKTYAQSVINARQLG